LTTVHVPHPKVDLPKYTGLLHAGHELEEDILQIGTGANEPRSKCACLSGIPFI
jgi:hypothetical protein